MHGSHGQFRKMTAYEEAIRIPMILAGGPAGRKVKSGRDTAPMNHVDIPATTLGLAGLPKPQWMQGTDYSPHVLDGRESPDDPDSAYLQSVIPTMHGDSVDRPWRGIVTRDGWKYASDFLISAVVLEVREVRETADMSAEWGVGAWWVEGARNGKRNDTLVGQLGGPWRSVSCRFCLRGARGSPTP